MRYGRKGGDGPNTGKVAAKYEVDMPDGSRIIKRIFNPPKEPCGFAYEHQGKWYLATVAEHDDQRFTGSNEHTRCPARRFE